MKTNGVLPGLKLFFPKPGILSFVRQPTLLLLAVLSAYSLARAEVASPSPPPSPEQKAFAAKLANAATAAEQDALLDKADLALFGGDGLPIELSALGFRRALEGDYASAEKIDRFIIRLGVRQKDPDWVATGQTMTGGVLRESGDYSEGLVLLEKARDFYDKDPAPTTEKVSVRQALGITYLYQGNFRRALSVLQRALKIATELKYREGIIPALNSMGEVFRTQGQPQRALEFYERARKEVGDDSAWNMAFIFNNIGMSYDAMGENEKAIDYINRARAVAEKVKFRPRVATSLAVLGNLRLKANEFADAAKSYQQSLELSVELHDKASEARADLGLANVDRARNKFGAGWAHAEKAVEIYRGIEQHDSVAFAQTLAGRCLLSLGKAAEARAAFTEATAEIEKVRGQLAGDADEAESFFARRIAPYQEMVAMLIEEGKPDQALAMSERANARALLDILAKGRNATRAALTESETRKREHLDHRLAEVNRQLNEEQHAEHPSALRRQALELQLTHARADREIFDAESSSSVSEEGHPPEPSFAALEEMLPVVKNNKTTVLKFVVTDEKTFLFVLHEKEGRALVETFPIAESRAQLTKQALAYRSLLSDRSLNWQPAARALYRTLLQNSEAAWQDADSLTIIPDGPLWELPFQALQTPNRHCLIENRAITYAPSITFLARVGHEVEKKPAASDRLLAIANPALGFAKKKPDHGSTFASARASLMGETWEPLPAAEEEVAELEKLYGPDKVVVLTGAQAREDTFKTEARDFDIIHFATHGVLIDRAPLYSYLLMSQDDLTPGEDGLLEAWELMRMKLHSRLAVLSACETARGKISEGEGVIGLSWALLAAGCPAAVVSQWKVDSASNTDLMVDFHRRFRAGASAAESLRQASIALAKNPEYRHPFYWAPFVVIGQGL